MSGRLGPKVRLKLVALGGEKILFVRFPGGDPGDRIASRLRDSVPPGRCAFDGEVHHVRGELFVRDAVRLLRGSCEAVYSHDLLREHVGLPNPWDLPEDARRNWSQRPIVYMARIWDPEKAESIAFQLPRYDDDFMIEFRRTLSVERSAVRYRRDLKTWIVTDHRQGLVHDVLDRFYECWWDPLFGGDEWEVLPPPKNTQYPIRTLTDQDFHTLSLQPGCSIHDLHQAYRDKKQAYHDNQIDADEWYEVDTAFQRLQAHYRPTDEDDDLPGQVTAPRPIMLLLRQVFDSEPERVRWYYRHQHAVGGVPRDLADSAQGQAQVEQRLKVMALLRSQPRA